MPTVPDTQQKDQASVRSKPLVEWERKRLTELEKRVEKGLDTFARVGRALQEIRDSRYYRQEYETFEDYCRDRWAMARQRAHQLIQASRVVANVNHGRQNGIVPSSERHARPLTQFKPEVQREIWGKVVATAPTDIRTGGPKITSPHIQETMREMGLAPPSGDDYTPLEITDDRLRWVGSSFLGPIERLAKIRVSAEELFAIVPDYHFNRIERDLEKARFVLAEFERVWRKKA